jgi:hypothetical protein
MVGEYKAKVIHRQTILEPVKYHHMGRGAKNDLITAHTMSVRAPTEWSLSKLSNWQ